jgi:hypothetical protein
VSRFSVAEPSAPVTKRTGRAIAKADVFDYIERFYNSKLSTIGYLSLWVRAKSWISNRVSSNRVQAKHATLIKNPFARIDCFKF